MQLQYFETVESSGWGEDVYRLLVMADREFIPPLSSRGSSTQSDLSHATAAERGARDYYESMASQPVVLALEDDRCLGFMAFKFDYTCEYIGEDTLPNLYASTCVVHPDARGRKLMEGFYREMIRLFPEADICTRTWHTNAPHLRVLEKLGFRELARLKDHRGPGLDTVYFHRRKG